MNFNIPKLVREVLSEPGGGTLSWGRIASTTTLFAALAWVTHLVLKTGALPALDGISGFIIAPYAANKAATAMVVSRVFRTFAEGSVWL